MSNLENALASNPLIQAMAWQQTNQNALNAIAGSPKGGLRATVVDVDDPEERGRIKVVFDDMNPKKPQIEGATGDGGYGTKRPGAETYSHWIDTKPAFKGKQPKRLVGLRVSVNVSDGQYQYAVLDDVLWDEGVLTEKTFQPNTGTMVRLPCYESGEFPPPTEENVGLMAVELGGPMGADWVCVVLKRQGEYIWVRHVDLQHGHAGENDGKQPNDSAGDSEQPVNEQSIWDYAFPTSAKAMPKQSAYGTSPRPNPYGGRATWNEPPS
jgi:hypothetical protein